MKRVDELFKIHRSQSHTISRYEAGDVAYVASGLSDNGVSAWVKPLRGDRVFKFRGIAVSSFCEATVQVAPFIGYGCAGTSVMALEPRQPMAANQLAFAAAYLNLTQRWRFSWYWRAIVPRLARLKMPATIPDDVPFNVREAMPSMSSPRANDGGQALNLGRFTLGEIFDLKAGDYHSVGRLPRGRVPMISCGGENNGVTGYCDVPHAYSHKLTIAFNGMNTLTAKYHPYDFAAKDDVAVCFPNRPLQLTTQLFIAVMLNRERWRYSFYRKCFVEKLRRFAVALPAKDGDIDEGAIKALVESSPYWRSLNARMTRESAPA